ncbi:MAG: hypothetical protein RL660_850 [Bacteroidota bacterium]|jgi:XTP/dITP diphosphohydrolase
MELVFATHNENKVREIASALPEGIVVKSLASIGITEPIAEPFDTIEENSATKAQFIFDNYKLDCFSEDTGLIVPSLNGEPGVYSARYAGENANAADNMAKLLHQLNGVADRDAHFKTVITLMRDGKQHQFTGICEGTIISEARGEAGFGYDPIFVPKGSDKTFAQMPMAEKNLFSHRKKALSLLLDFLNTEDRDY